MPTTTNRRRAYIRRSRAIQWSSQRRSYQASTSPLDGRWGRSAGSARGAGGPLKDTVEADLAGPCSHMPRILDLPHAARLPGYHIRIFVPGGDPGYPAFFLDRRRRLRSRWLPGENHAARPPARSTPKHGTERHPRNHQGRIASADLQELIVQRASHAPEDVGRGFRKLAEQRQLEAMDVRDHAPDRSADRQMALPWLPGQWPRTRLVALGGSLRSITFDGARLYRGLTASGRIAGSDLRSAFSWSVPEGLRVNRHGFARTNLPRRRPTWPLPCA
jgi:hypothetical protein